MSERHFTSRLERYKEEYADRMGWHGSYWRKDAGKLREAESYAFEMMECEDTYQSYRPLGGHCINCNTPVGAPLRSEDPKEVIG